MDAAQWHQELGLVKPMEQMLMGASTTNPNQGGANSGAPIQALTSSTASTGAQIHQQQMQSSAGGAAAPNPERRARPQKEKVVNCPRCNSTNTKFCYYNNYSLTQPRYFCKTCRRYWTEGGSLRNVPVGGGSRKNKRTSSSQPSSSATAAAISSVAATASAIAATGGGVSGSKHAKFLHEGAHDLNLSFPMHPPPDHQFGAAGAAFPSLESSSVPNASAMGGTSARGNGVGGMSAMELLRSTGCYMPMPMQMPVEYATGFGMDLRAATQPMAIGFSLDHGSGGGDGGGGGGGYGGLHHGVQESGGRLLFPFEDLKPVASSGTGNSGGGGDFEQRKEQGGGGGDTTTTGFWISGMFGGGGTGSW